MQWEDTLTINEGAPSAQPEDPRESGQNPAYAEHWWHRLRAYANQEFYAKQIHTRLAELTKARDTLVAHRDGMNAEIAALDADIVKTAGLFK
jgi:hypothetical protein